MLTSVSSSRLNGGQGDYVLIMAGFYTGINEYVMTKAPGNVLQQGLTSVLNVF